MTNLLKLPTWADKTRIHAVVETHRGSRCKLESAPKRRAFTRAKPLLAGLTYPYDWGVIPSTEAEDGDPLDVLMIHDAATRSEEHTSELQSPCNLVCRLLLEKKNKENTPRHHKLIRHAQVPRSVLTACL